MDFCELYSLSRSDLQEVVAKWPELALSFDRLIQGFRRTQSLQPGLVEKVVRLGQGFQGEGAAEQQQHMADGIADHGQILGLHQPARVANAAAARFAGCDDSESSSSAIKAVYLLAGERTDDEMLFHKAEPNIGIAHGQWQHAGAAAADVQEAGEVASPRRRAVLGPRGLGEFLLDSAPQSTEQVTEAAELTTAGVAPAVQSFLAAPPAGENEEKDSCR